jgi:hypothetical protein
LDLGTEHQIQHHQAHRGTEFFEAVLGPALQGGQACGLVRPRSWRWLFQSGYGIFSSSGWFLSCLVFDLHRPSCQMSRERTPRLFSTIQGASPTFSVR